MSLVIAPATEADAPLIASLLTASGLPTDGLRDHVATALVARVGASVVGSAALELHGRRDAAPLGRGCGRPADAGSHLLRSALRLPAVGRVHDGVASDGSGHGPRDHPMTAEAMLSHPSP